MLEKIFESLDEKVFTDELKSNLQEQFEGSVKVAADELHEKFVAEQEIKNTELIAEKIEEKVQELEEKAEEFQAVLVQESKEKEEVLLEQVDSYLEKVVDDFLKESKEALDESIKSEKADMIIEAMDSMIVSTGVEIARISEAKDSKDAEKQLEESTSKYDELVEENIKLEKEVQRLLKMGIIAEMKEGLSVVEADKFSKLADLVEFSKSEDYTAKLDTIKESIKKVKTDDVLEEKTKEPKSVSKSEDSLTTRFNHLI